MPSSGCVLTLAAVLAAMCVGDVASAVRVDVVTNNAECTNLLARHAKDLGVEEMFVGAALCEGVVHPMDTGLGGGFQGLLFDGANDSATFVMSRERAPVSPSFLSRGPLIFGSSVGVPSAIAGYDLLLRLADSRRRLTRTRKLMAKRYNAMIGAIADLSERGFRVSPTFAAVYPLLPSLPELVPRNNVTGRAINPSLARFVRYTMKRAPLARRIRENVYGDGESPVRDTFMADVARFNGRFEKRDFATYRPTLAIVKPRTVRLRRRSWSVYAAPRPSSGRSIRLFLMMLDALQRAAESRGRDGAVARRVLADRARSFELFARLSLYVSAAKLYMREARFPSVRHHPRIARWTVERCVRLSAAPRRSPTAGVIPRIFGAHTMPRVTVLRRPVSSSSSPPPIFGDNSTATVIPEYEYEYDEAVHGDDGVDQNYTESTPLISPIDDPIDGVEDDDEEEEESVDEVLETKDGDDEGYTSGGDNDDDDPDEWFFPLRETNVSLFREEGGTVDRRVSWTAYAEPDSSGTTNVIVRRGDRLIVATSSINHSFGSMICTRAYGFCYNNQLRDFSPANWRIGGKPMRTSPRPGATPPSSMSPTVLRERGGRRRLLAIGAAGGFKITGAVLNVLWHHVMYGRSLRESVAAKRLIVKLDYHAGRYSVWLERGGNFGGDELARRLPRTRLMIEAGYSAVTAYSEMLSSRGETAVDPRRGGSGWSSTAR